MTCRFLTSLHGCTFNKLYSPGEGGGGFQKIMGPALNVFFLSCPWDIHREMSRRFGHKGLPQRRAQWVIEIWETLL